ncbi:PREDICTED: pentatricopeptide repeat-containing protein At4g13650 [Tarenaya hassleriana]|uniref:pentatricopeptide repeat-containing protein At4g13650 n=1 Tax=Tarenaya hassleriana TaxID=28532 RepID=UPI00053C1D84|nr:PREDICTED: pentatricopeptide repeat-containing protein At4g13650 [Tarenaya hassleriana]XP_010528730.1 PREDICTED: pentatricopeptide repeat-containing protein At4g13650 [Tarenaya hassleriana]
MFLWLVSLHGSSSFLFLRGIPRKLNAHNAVHRFCEIRRRVRISGFGTSSAAVSTCFFENESFRDQEAVKMGIDSVCLSENRGIRPNHETFLWLLEGRLKNDGSLNEGKKLQGKILKLGFDTHPLMCDKLLDFYLFTGDMNGALKVFDEMTSRTVFTWNRMILEFASRKLNRKVIDLVWRMVSENVNMNGGTFSSILKACGSGSDAFDVIKQIHARIICQGFGNSTTVCNPLIDLYSKNGFVGLARRIFDKLHFKDYSSWVAMISGLSQNECEAEAIGLFREMHILGVIPTPYAFSSVLSACAKLALLEVGEQIQGLVLKLGFSSETYVCNALVTLYSRLGKLILAENIFSNMTQRDAVTYNSLISGLAKCGYGDKAMGLFEKMQFDGQRPDCITVASLVSACSSLGALVKGQQLHAYITKLGFSSDIIIEGALLDLYVKCSEIETSLNFFLETETENVVLWNVMLVAYGQLDDLTNSFRIFRKMQMEGIIPNQFTYPSVLKTCTRLGALDLGEQIHSLVVKTGFQLNAYVCSVLIDMYSKLGEFDIARDILVSFAGEDVVSWTAMIAGYKQYNFFDKALAVFREMLDHGIHSDNIGLASAVSACAGLLSRRIGQQIHAQSYVSGYSADDSIQNALVTLYSRCGKLQEAYLAFDRSESGDNISWNALVSGFAQSGHCEEALRVFTRMNREGIVCNMFTFGSAVSAAADTANMKQGKQIHAAILKTGYDSETEVCNALISMYAQCGSIYDAKRQFFEVFDKNEVSWNAMISGYSQHGFGTEALDLFQRMRNSDIRPTHVTFVGVLSACSHIGSVDNGLEYFESMTKEYGLVPKPEHYVCVVDILSRAGLLNRAKEFIQEMPIEPDGLIWRTLLSASVVHKNVEIGELAARHLLELEPEDSATYVLLSNVYAVCRKWDARDRTRQMMKENGVKKEPGRSWIEVKNSIHSFFVGDRHHPLANKIYKYLGDLNKRASGMGYVQDRLSLLNEVDQEKKDPTLFVHSEKLAVSFGLLSLPTTMPIRVMKNLRVCNDCHIWIKCISKITNRAIIVRDAYRFHHFEGGSCSCRDYW